MDTVYKSDHSHGLPVGWSAYDNWGKPTLDSVKDGPIGPAARLRFDDVSTVEHFDKGFVINLPQPTPWSQASIISARYYIDHQVGNIRIFAHSDDGGWWDFTDPHVVIGQAARVKARDSDFRLAWTDNPNQPAPAKTGRILAVYVSVHNNVKPNSGLHFELEVSNLQISTVLLPVTQPVRTDAPPLDCWPIATAGGSWASAVGIPVGDTVVQAELGRTIRVRVDGHAASDLTLNGVPVRLRPDSPDSGSVGDVSLSDVHLPGPITVSVNGSAWAGRAISVPALSTAEALALSARTGAVRWRPAAAHSVAGQPIEMDRFIPWPWTGVPARAGLEDGAGRPVSFKAAGPGPCIAYLTLQAHPSVILATAVTVSEVDAQAMSRDAARADLQAWALGLRIQSGRGESWWAGAPATTSPAIRDRERVDPVRWSRIKDPVTWKDLGGDFVGGVQCNLSAADLDLYCGHYDFGRLIKPHLSNVMDPDWQANCQRAAARNLLVGSVWGYVPDVKWNGGFGEVAIPPAQQKGMIDILGRHFLGYEMGEQDGRYIGGYAPQYKPATRQQARELFDEWHQTILTKFYNDMVALGSLNFSHEYARLNLRMLGLETAQGLPSDIMEWSFLRGAAKQFGALTWNCISIWNRWGYKSYGATGPDHGPDKGTSLELMKRLWYVTWLYGSAANAFEGAYLLPDKDQTGYPALSPVGQTDVDAVRFARQHPDRGVLYTPVAIMLDRDAGWVPPRHLYTSARDLVWGNIPYGRADYATDAFFRWIWPHYEDASYYPDERGFLTATPLGDKFDVILSDAPDECLRRYQTLILIGAVHVNRDRLARFVENGGEIVTDAGAGLGSMLTGVAFSGSLKQAQRSVLCPNGEILSEEPYAYRVGRSMGAVALALSEHGDGILWDHRVGRGRVITCSVPDYVCASAAETQTGVDVPLKHDLLQAFEKTLGPYLQSLDLVTVDGPPVQVLCNVGREPGKLIVSVVNNQREPATVTISRRQGSFGSVTPWLGAAHLQDGKIVATVPPLDLVILDTREHTGP
jgi:hypothetical protein